MSVASSYPPESNPFRSSQIDKIPYQPLNTDLDAIMSKLRGMDFRGAITGPHGHGKTTLMENIMKRLSDENQPVKHLRLNLTLKNQRLVWLFSHKLNSDDVVLLDGADLLNPLAWIIFKLRVRHTKGLIITTHRDGLLPTLHACTTSCELQWELISSLAPDHQHKLKAFSKALFEKHKGNIRSSLRELYDQWAEGRLT